MSPGRRTRTLGYIVEHERWGARWWNPVIGFVGGGGHNGRMAHVFASRNEARRGIAHTLRYEESVGIQSHEEAVKDAGRYRIVRLVERST